MPARCCASGSCMAVWRWEESTQEHHEILEALKARDGERARRLLADHVQHTGDAIAAINRG
ncbi:hypothetical protein CR157_04835 [Halomonas sp. LBP4]|nr:hypothetical protein CR157_04835 [Halomonas sp. LBP4]